MTSSANPAELFIRLWNDVAKLSGFERNAAAAPVCFEQQIRDALAADDGAAASAACTALLGGKTYKAERHGKMLAVMTVIDEYFELIHPRSRIFSPSTAPPFACMAARYARYTPHAWPLCPRQEPNIDCTRPLATRPT